MKGSHGFSIVAGLGVALAVAAVWAGGPPNPTMSDAAGNTAGGSSALFNLNGGQGNTAFGDRALQGALSGFSGFFNTAVGEAALTSDDTGNDNTATGALALAKNHADA